MKKLSTLVFIVKKFSGQKTNGFKDNLRNFLALSDEKSGISPSAGSIRKIMDFANSYEVLDSKTTGQIELNSN